jgi:response regulator RpfG family c-di-GMP phosphodiesterase
MGNTNPTILLVEDEPEILNLLILIIECEFELNITTATTGNEAIKILEEDDSIFYVFTDYHMPDGTGADLFNYNKKHKNLPLTIFSGGFFDEYEDIQDLCEVNPLNKFLNKPADEEDIHELIRKVLKSQDNAPDLDEVSLKEEKVKRVQIPYYALFQERPLDLYIKLAGGKLLQIANKGNNDQNEIVAHYIDKGVDYIYLTEEDFSIFIDLAKTSIRKRVEQKPEALFEIMGLTYSMSKDHLQSLRVSSLQIELVNESLRMVFQDISANSDLFDKLKEMFDVKNYMADHSFLVIYLASQILNKMGHSNPSLLKQVSYAAFFHDIALKDETMAMITHLNQVEDPQEKLIISKHMEVAAKLLEDLPGINHDAHNMIMEHHELPDGSGFPLGMDGSRISKMSAIFIVSHIIVDALIDANFRNSKVKVAIEDLTIFESDPFKKPWAIATAIVLPS